MIFIQRVYTVIEAGAPGHLMCLVPITGPVDIPEREHFRDERHVAGALRELADKIEQGIGYYAVPGLSEVLASTDAEE